MRQNLSDFSLGAVRFVILAAHIVTKAQDEYAPHTVFGMACDMLSFDAEIRSRVW